MKKHFLFFILISILFVYCKKEKTTEPEKSGTPPNFISLYANDSTLLVNDTTTITAVATGEQLTYTWSYETFVSLVTNGNRAIFSNCHGDAFIVYCDVENPWGKVRKEITIYVH